MSSQEWAVGEELFARKTNHHSVRKGTTAEISGIDSDDLETGDVFYNSTINKIVVNVGSSNSPQYTDDFVPIGTVRPFMRTAPSNWAICHGQELSKFDYPLLFNVLGDTYGSATQGRFRVPRLNTSRKMILGATLDTHLNQQGGVPAAPIASLNMPRHSHKIRVPEYINAATRTSSTDGYRVFALGGRNPTDPLGRLTDVGSGAAPIHENNPPYIEMRYFIKAKEVVDA